MMKQLLVAWKRYASKSTILVSLSVLAIVLALIMFPKSGTVLKDTTETIIDNGSQTFETISWERKTINRNKTLDEMHKMANTKIVADEIWGEIDITPQRCEKLITNVEKSDYTDKAILLDMLNRWKEGDYLQMVDDHNYLWNELDGTVGRATGLRYQ